MDLRGTKDNIWLKPIYGIEFYCPPSEDGGNSDGGNSDGGNSDGGNSDGGNSMNRNVALAYSTQFKQTKLALAK